jgi:hypothetical protein
MLLNGEISRHGVSASAADSRLKCAERASRMCIRLEPLDREVDGEPDNADKHFSCGSSINHVRKPAQLQMYIFGNKATQN